MRENLKTQKEFMKKILMGLGFAVMLAGCASNDNGMGGTSDQSTSTQQSTTSDQSLKTDSINKDTSGNPTGSSTAPNYNSTQGTP
jgi:uncharacterized lipoprotein YajG